VELKDHVATCWLRPQAVRAGLGKRAAVSAARYNRAVSSPDEGIVKALRESMRDLVAVYRSGSTVSGFPGADSDIDLAILAGSRLDSTERFDLQERLSTMLRRQVDLVDLRAASTVMAIQVVGSGALLYDGDAAERGRFEDLTYSQYARLNEERRGVLDRIAREGTVHGR
jgi:uncharacterized protein